MKYTLCPPLPFLPLALKPDKPSAVSAGCSCSNHPSERTLARRPRNTLSSPIQQQQQQQQPLHIYAIYESKSERIGIALRLSSALCYVALGRGEKGTRVPFCCLLRFWIRLWFWLVARPTTFRFSVCSKMHLAGYIFGWLFVSCCLRLHCDFHGAHANVANAPLWH